MRIAIIGRGNIGRTLGERWRTAGHEVVYGSRTPGDDSSSISGAVESAEVVVLAVPGAAAKELVASLGPALEGKVVVDTTNDVQGSGKLHALDELHDGAHPVRAFNTLGWENFSAPVLDGQRADLLYGAEEGRAQDVAEQLIRDIGLEPVWLGGVDEFDVVDGLTRVWFTLVFKRGYPRRTALKVISER